MKHIIKLDEETDVIEIKGTADGVTSVKIESVDGDFRMAYLTPTDTRELIAALSLAEATHRLS